MPTGYTSEIAHGVDFNTFVLHCARAFGATITMRDDPMDATIPDEFKPSDYHAKEAERALIRLGELTTLSVDEAQAEAQREYKDALRVVSRLNSESVALQRKYEDMLEQVHAWTPPTPEHEELKKFMIQQITESIKFDCSYHHEDPVLLSGVDWLQVQKDKCRRDVAYHQEEHAKEVERCKGRTEWVRALKNSLTATA